MNKFWNVKAEGNKSRLDLFGYVGGKKDDPWSVEGFDEKEFLSDFRKIPEGSDLEISINSFGGAVYTALSIYSLLKTHKGSITFRIDGAAMSAATIITSVPGAKVIMPKGSMMMIHNVSSGVWGNASDMRKAADDIDKLEQNIIDIYAEKSGKSVEEIKDKVNVETFFTAQEAVDFGLADEVDESQTVENTINGDYFMVNGLKIEADLIKRAPVGLFKAQAVQASAKEKEVPSMDFNQLKAEHPDWVEALRNEGAEAERARIQAIEDIAVAGHEDLVNAAKFDGKTTAENLAVQILKANKTRATNMLQKRQEDAQALADLEPEGNQGITKDKDLARRELVNQLKADCKFGGNH